MKKIVLAVFMAAMALSLSAQINFREGGFAEALEAAKSENKLSRRKRVSISIPVSCR